MNTLSELPLDPISETLHNKIPNWEMVSEIVNATSIISRSARQVRHALDFHRFGVLRVVLRLDGVATGFMSGKHLLLSGTIEIYASILKRYSKSKNMVEAVILT